ncbi:hypothetical protein GmHk_20G059114 [Glycine max]|nr:hypothetical protein GmHk_20G059114 [Glycine max]
MVVSGKGNIRLEMNRFSSITTSLLCVRIEEQSTESWTIAREAPTSYNFGTAAMQGLSYGEATKISISDEKHLESFTNPAIGSL